MAAESKVAMAKGMAKAHSSDGSDGEWRFAYEALQNVRAVQLLLFHPRLSPVQDCPNFTAAVRSGELRCAWGEDSSLSVPLPAPCLLDLSRPPRCWTRADHVEVRIGLLSLDPDLCWLGIQEEPPRNDPLPFSVEFDAQALESSEAVQFYCRECSCKLTNTPFRRVLEVPSMDWREVSEHFYGNCCCASFGAQAELLVARFQELLTPSEATCLVASTTCVVHKGDVIVQDAAAQPSEGGQNDSDPFVNISGTDSRLIHHQNGVEDTALGEKPQEVCVDGSEVSHEGEEDLCCSSRKPASTASSAKNGATDSKLTHHQNGVDDTTLAEETHEVCVEVSHEGEDPCCSLRKPASTESSVSELAEEIQELCLDGSHEGEEDHCCSSRESASTAFPAMKKGASPESLGNGFMTGPGSQSEVRDWEPFLCWGCSSIVGAKRDDGSKKGVQFFKCKISTHESALSSSNIFRKHTLERLFTHELEKNTESNSSYRYVVRSFQTGAALLQLVLVNEGALVSSGICHPTSTSDREPEFLDDASGCEAEEGKRHPTLKRKPAIALFETVAKFMFCDCRTLNSDELRLIDKWAHVQNADDIFMLDEVVGTLVDLLKSHQMAYPTSCQLFQQFGWSFLTK